jgi:hypothetical protein
MDLDYEQEYRILGSGVHTVSVNPEDETVTLPNYCKQQLNAEQYLSLSLKASTYLVCWQLAHAVEDIANCPAELQEPCVDELTEFEVLEVPEAPEGEGEEGEGEEGGEEAPAEEEAAEGEGEEGEGEGEEECHLNEEGEVVGTAEDGEPCTLADIPLKEVPHVTDL